MNLAHSYMYNFILSFHKSASQFVTGFSETHIERHQEGEVISSSDEPQANKLQISSRRLVLIVQICVRILLLPPAYKTDVLWYLYGNS